MMNILVLLAEDAALLVYRIKVPTSRKRNLEFLLHRRVRPFPPASQVVSQAAAMRYSEHPFSGWSLNPDFLNVMGERIHNRQGFRDDQDFETLDPTALRIYCAGDSTTYSTNIEDNHGTWPFLLGQYLNDKQQHAVSVINGGVGGYFTFQSMYGRPQSLRVD